MTSDGPTTEPREDNEELRTRLADGIKEAFTFLFLLDEHCRPGGKGHYVSERHFHLNGHVFVLHDIRLFSGLTYRSEANTGDFNVRGYFYTFSENKDVKPEYSTGTFKINYDTAIVKGTTNNVLSGDRPGICDMTIDFKLAASPSVDLYCDGADGSVGQLDVNRAGSGEKIAEVLWPSVRALLHSLFRDKLWKISSERPWNSAVVPDQYLLHDDHRRSKASHLLNDIITKMKSKLTEKTEGGRLPMPDIDLMVASASDPEKWGRFKATFGSLGDVTGMHLNSDPAVYATSENEIVVVGWINFPDWKYCYDEFTIKASTGDGMGKIVSTVGENEAFVMITAIRNDKGATVVKDGRFEYINASNKHDITSLGEFEWLKGNVLDWMAGLMGTGIPDLNKTINDCLKEVLVDFDMFLFLDEPNVGGVADENLVFPETGEDQDSAPVIAGHGASGDNAGGG